jgi:hypothetical protein
MGFEMLANNNEGFEEFLNPKKEKAEDAKKGLDISRREFGIGAVISAVNLSGLAEKIKTEAQAVSQAPAVEPEVLPEKPVTLAETPVEVEQVVEEAPAEASQETVTETINEQREYVDWTEFKNLKPTLSYREVVPKMHIENLKLPGKVGKYGADTHTGKMIRTLRYKNLTDAVEHRYNLPSGILLAMVMEESTGVDLLPNARGDGGFGLSHMQGATAAEYGLETFGGCTAMVCDGKDSRSCKGDNGELLNHAKDLAELMKAKHDDRPALIDADERLHRLLNLDAVGRMLAAGIGGPKIAGLGSFRTAIRRYSGKYNYEKYWADIRTNMKDLDNSVMLDALADEFNAHNAQLRIDGTPADFYEYLKRSQQENENYDLEAYKKMTKYIPDNSDKVLTSYKEFL